MKKLTFSIALIFGCLLIWSDSLGAAPKGSSGPKPVSTPVTSQILDIDASGGTPLSIRSDSGVSFSQYYTSSGGVVSRIQEGGEWELDARASDRTLFVDLPPLTAQYVPARLVTKCFLVSETVVGTMQGAGSTLECPLVLRFNHTAPDGAVGDYRLHLNWDSPGTDSARITCLEAAGDGQCTKWQIDPAGANGSSVGRLYKFETIRKKLTPVEVGDFPVTFRFVVSNP